MKTILSTSESKGQQLLSLDRFTGRLTIRLSREATLLIGQYSQVFHELQLLTKSSICAIAVTRGMPEL